MPLLRGPLLHVARFVAGATTEDALRTVSSLAADGRFATLDHLGENVTSRADAQGTVAAYRSLLTALDERGLAGRA